MPVLEEVLQQLALVVVMQARKGWTLKNNMIFGNFASIDLHRHDCIP
jgi:hypothetical protein